ncbi:acetyl-CoA C-acyltransferase [uncultured Roseobacter sp.]|uniref:acetyl-CoA C-acyltransferase n=1 Tax=uncultured Roseobacter sp. TaxID=114847 RepID=UPI002616F7AF|nr:acetyl-CoA C-acyltransferase [uncultured Roseobacter sp.]
MKQAVFLAAGRTGLAKSFRGSLNQTHGATMMGHVIAGTLAQSGLAADEVEDVVIGCGYPEAETGGNIARQSALRAGLPITSAGQTVSRFCASGLQAIATAANAITQDGAGPQVAGGVESISLIQPRIRRVPERTLAAEMPQLYHTMIETADLVADRYGISRADQDAFALLSQQRIAAAQQAGHFSAEILPMDTVMQVNDRDTGETRETPVTLDRDECNRPGTTLEGLAGLTPVREGGFVTAGNASQLSDGAAAVVMMEAGEAEARGLTPLGAFRGFAVAGCGPEEMGIGPVFAVPLLLERHGLSVGDIDLWELNEAFASQALYCRETLGLDPDKVNVNGGSIAIGHPFGMTGARLVAHVLHEGRRRSAKLGVVTMCIAGGMGAAGLIEIYPGD